MKYVPLAVRCSCRLSGRISLRPGYADNPCVGRHYSNVRVATSVHNDLANEDVHHSELLGKYATVALKCSADLESSSTLSPTMDDPKFFRKADLLLRKLRGLPDSVSENREESPFEKLVSPAESREVMKRETELLVQKLVKCLEAVSTTMKTHIESKSVIGEFVMKRSYYSGPLPEMPKQWNSKDELVRYLERLSGRIHVDPKFSSPTGLIAMIIKDLLRPNNGQTREVLSTDAFNWGIRYFVRLGDVRSARTLYYDMLLVGTRPTTLTYNMLLYPLRKVFRNPNGVWRQHPVLVACQYLRQMRQQGVSANTETWNICLVMLPHKATLLATMRARGIWLDSRSVSACLDDVCAVAGPSAAAGYLRVQQDTNVGDDAVHTVLRHFLQRGDIAKAWDFLLESEQRGMKPKKRTLNVFCAEFARIFRADWVFSLMSTFKSRWAVNPDSHTYAHLLEAVVRLPSCPQKWDVVAIAADLCSKRPNIDQRRWRDKADNQLALARRLGKTDVQLGTPLSRAQKSLLRRALDITWGSTPMLEYTAGSEASKVAESLGIPQELHQGEDVGRPLLVARRKQIESSSPVFRKNMRFYASLQKSRNEARINERTREKKRLIQKGPLAVFSEKISHSGIVKHTVRGTNLKLMIV